MGRGGGGGAGGENIATNLYLFFFIKEFFWQHHFEIFCKSTEVIRLDRLHFMWFAKTFF